MNGSNVDRKYLAYASSTLGAVIGGCSFVFSKIVLGAGMSFYQMIFCRMVIAVAAALLLYALGLFPLQLKGKPVVKAMLCSLFYPGFGLMLEMLALNYTTTAELSAFDAMVPVGVMILARLIFREEQTGLQRLAIVTSVAGVLLIVFSDGFQLGTSHLGHIIVLVAVICSCCYNLTVKWLTSHFTNPEITFINILTALILYSLVMLINGGVGELRSLSFAPGQLAQVIASLCFLGVCNSVGTAYMNSFSIRIIGATRHTSFAGIITLTTVVLGRLVLQEHLLPLKYLGMLLIVAGAWGANYFSPAAIAGRKKEA
ncbi:MAG: DMT family transporter [Firmicutes bacterium]|nr:DMT family transporter [Bacillota bacterium]